jgi:hypothetical protein
MLAVLLVVLRSLASICSGHRALALENVALRQQLAVFRRTARRPQLRTRDRLFWVLLAKAWPKWRTALIVVQPDTVVRWHRQWLRRRWTQRSRHAHPGRPSTAAAIRTLIDKMGAANPLWGSSSDPRRTGQAGHRGARPTNNVPHQRCVTACPWKAGKLFGFRSAVRSVNSEY